MDTSGTSLQPKQFGGEVVATSVSRRGESHFFWVGLQKANDLRHRFMG